MSIYLDYAAATPLDERVFEVMKPYLKEQFYNPSAQYGAATAVRRAFETARHRIAQVIGGKQQEIICTAGATESLNLAVHGVMRLTGGRVVTAGIEHTALLASAACYDHDLTPVTSRGCVTPQAVEQAITPQTSLVSIGYVNNELGVVQPLGDIAAVVARERQRRLAAGETRPIRLHTDASQAMGLLDVSVSRLGVDMMTLNAGKCYGPRQAGVLWAQGGIELSPLIYGGNQENGVRAGTENVAAVIGMAEAFANASQERKTESPRLRQLRDRLQYRLCEAFDDLVVNGHPKKRAPHILHVSLPGLDGERAVFALDQRGVMAATGSACAANKGTASHVLAAIGMDDRLINGSLRLSLGKYTTASEIDAAAEIIIETLRVERSRS